MMWYAVRRDMPRRVVNCGTVRSWAVISRCFALEDDVVHVAAERGHALGDELPARPGAARAHVRQEGLADAEMASAFRVRRPSAERGEPVEFGPAERQRAFGFGHESDGTHLLSWEQVTRTDYLGANHGVTVSVRKPGEALWISSIGRRTKGRHQ